MGILSSPQEAIPFIFAMLVALTFHEAAHAWVADRLGDPTPRSAGRLSLNPLVHIDPVGALFFIIARFGWAKPVPVNSSYFKNPRRDDLLVSAAGPMSNLLVAIVMAFLLRVVVILAPAFPETQLADTALQFTFKVTYWSVWVNVGLAFFNLLPIPPLDGSWILGSLLPPRWSIVYDRYKRYGIFVLILLLFTGGLGTILFPLVNGVAGILMGR